MAKNPHFAVEDLSEEARRIIRDGIERNDREQAIRERVAEQTKEKIASSSLNRYACWYRARMRRREAVSERMEAAVKTAASLGQELQDAVQAELLDVLFDAAQEGKLGEIGPTGAARLALAFQESDRRSREVAVKEQLVGVREREIVILEKKLADALDRQHAVREQAQRAKKAMEAAKASGGQLPEEVEKQVLAIYGLTEAN